MVAGVFAGSLLGARMSSKVRSIWVLFLLIVVTGWLAGVMVYKIATGAF